MGSDATHRSAQMKPENATNGLGYGNPTMLFSKVYPRGSKTPEDIERDINCREHGPTRFNDTWLVLNYFNAAFDMRVAARNVGYRGNDSLAASSLSFRLARINPISFFDVARSLINAKRMCKSNFKVILGKPYTYKQKCEGHSKVSASFYEYYAKRLVTEALTKYKGSLVVTAQQLGIKVEDVEYWMAIKVKDVMAKPVRYMPDPEEV